MTAERRNLIIVPVVCGPQMTRRAILSALAQDIAGGVEVIAIDNGSEDGTAAMLRTLPVTVWTRSERSLNAVWNEALHYAFDVRSLPHALVINNDLVLRPDAYRLLAADGGLFVTGVSVSTQEGTRHANPQSRSPHPCFSCFLVRRTVWQRVGAFDERYWAFASDGDYHLRMDRAGIDAYAIDVPFLHAVSGTLKTLDQRRRELTLKRADADRETFRQTYGFVIGSPEYYAAFRHVRENRYATTGRLA